MHKRVMNKLGVSAVVATVLIIMITIAAIGIIWAAIIPMVRDNLGVGDVCRDVDISIETSQGYTCYDAAQKILSVHVSKGSSNVLIDGLKFFASSAGSSVPFQKEISFTTNDYKVFYLNTSTLASLDKISIIPIVKSGNADKECSAILLGDIPACSTGAIVVSSGSGSGSGSGSISPGDILNPTTPISCIANCTCAAFTLVGQNCSDGCGGICSGEHIRDGTLSYPFAISDCEELQNMSNNLSASYILINNIDCSATETWNYNPSMSYYEGFIPVGNVNAAFTGNFDGNGNIISNLTINFATDYLRAGLFGLMSGSVSNVGLINVKINVSSYTQVGGLVGELEGTISGSYTTGNILGYYPNIGGLVGSSHGAISNSHSTVDVNSYSSITNSNANYIGGLVALNYGTISNSYSTGSVYGYGHVGGLAGVSGSTISNSYSRSNVYGYNQVGGLVGDQSFSLISNSYSTGNVSGYSQIGGLSGSQIGTTNVVAVSNSYSTSNVSGSTSIGGLIGGTYRGIVSNSYSKGNVSSSGSSGGLIGSNGMSVSGSYWDTETSNKATSNGGTGLNTIQMKNISTFSAWDINIWNLTNGQYPKLKWQN